jgi:hypothetical protein
MRINNVLMSIVIATSLSANAATPSYPQKPVKVIVPFTEGSATDVIARMVTAKRSVANHNNNAITAAQTCRTRLHGGGSTPTQCINTHKTAIFPNR